MRTEKMLAALLAGLIILSLTGCGADKAENTSSDPATTESGITATVTESTAEPNAESSLPAGTELNNLLNACMPYVQTNMKASTLFDLALGVLRSGISDRLTRGESLLEQHHVPMDGTYSYLDVDGASVINMGSKSFPKNVRALHEFIYGEYIPAD